MYLDQSLDQSFPECLVRPLEDLLNKKQYHIKNS
jgi:hypothetical protein